MHALAGVPPSLRAVLSFVEMWCVVWSQYEAWALLLVPNCQLFKAFLSDGCSLVSEGLRKINNGSYVVKFYVMNRYFSSPTYMMGEFPLLRGKDRSSFAFCDHAGGYTTRHN
ncbi:hypothetical protein Naga_100234g8 [Nannochloropsis gaditana]|uniref:Uncharacterized protein n=1 Tax=Nannochloropsis gaditana TaxID=72520 RepID=W7TF88_9STRA|nr:hypothetical protein Naga_100234g8 [Nannochloropsis gaditana]